MTYMKEYVGISHTYRDLGDTCREWVPTAEYVAWLDGQWPKKSVEERIRLGWIKPGRVNWLRKAQEWEDARRARGLV